MMRKGFFAGVILIFCLPNTGLAEQSGPLTLEQTFRKVYQENPSLEASRYGLKATHELYPQALAGWHPVISSEVSVTSTNIESGNFNQGDGATTKSASISAEQPIFRGFRTTSESESAKSRIKAGFDRLKVTEQDVFLRTVEAYMDVIRDRMIVNLQDRNTKILAEELNSLNARFEAGDVTRTDVKQAEARLAVAEAEDKRARGNLKESDAVFEEVVGIPPPKDMILPVLNFSFPKTMQTMIALVNAQNPNLSVARNEHQAAISDIDVASSDLYPQVSAFASHIKEYDPQPGIVDESETSTVGLRARLVLYEGGKTRSRIREAKNRENQRYIETLVAEKEVKSEVMRNWSQLQAYQSEIAARELAVTAAKFSAEGVREEARLGERTTLDTLDAERETLEAEVALAKAKRDLIVTSYTLAASLGMLLPEHMGMSDIAYDPAPHYHAVSHRIFSTKED